MDVMIGRENVMYVIVKQHRVDCGANQSVIRARFEEIGNAQRRIGPRLSFPCLKKVIKNNSSAALSNSERG